MPSCFPAPSKDKKSILPFLFLSCFPALGPAWLQNCLLIPTPYPLPMKPQIHLLPWDPNLLNSLVGQPAALLTHCSAPRPSHVLSILSFHSPSQSPSGPMLTCARGTGAVGTWAHLGPICRERRDQVKGLQGGGREEEGKRAKPGRPPPLQEAPTSLSPGTSTRS